MNRIGDLGFLIGIFIIGQLFSSLNYMEIKEAIIEMKYILSLLDGSMTQVINLHHIIFQEELLKIGDLSQVFVKIYLIQTQIVFLEILYYFKL